jgi:beta-galactosidase
MLDGPGKLIGDNPFSLVGGTGAVSFRAGEEPGVLRLTAKHPRFGVQKIEINVRPEPGEQV